MEESGETKKINKKLSEVKTYSVPFALEKSKENITITTNAPSKPSKEEIINQAFKFHSKGNISEAAKLYQYLINQGFKDHQVFSNYGIILQSLGKLDEAEGLTRKAIEIKPDSAMLHFNLGTILTDHGNLLEAEVSTRKAIELYPDFAQAHSNLGNILCDLGKLKEAELSFCHAIKINPNSQSTYFLYANCLFKMRSLDKARININKANSINKNEVENYLISAAESVINTTKLQSMSQSKLEYKESAKKFDRIILNRRVESDLLSYLYTLKNKQLKMTQDARFGKGLCSTDFKLFQDNSKIISNLAKDIKAICRKELEKKEIIICDSFFNIFVSGSGAKKHNHIKQQDNKFDLNLYKYSLVYYLDIGDQKGKDPGILKLYDPEEEILPTNGMIVIIDGKKKHSVSYHGTKDRVMIGVNFYGF